MRYLTKNLLLDLKKKMVFIGGPRQTGKTTLAKTLMNRFREPIYLNWDDTEQKKEILARRWSNDNELMIFDELHKYKKWKNWIKGIYDTQKENHKFVITGSARMDVYRRGGDSLLGRYHYWRLHPFTISELPRQISPQEGLNRLMKVGGFPEPFLENDEKQARRWRRERLDRVLKDDVRDLESLKDISSLSLLVDLLRTRVGGPVVVKNLAENLEISQPTIKHWINVLEKMYLLFLVRPYSQNIARAIQKPPKIYFFDNADVEGDEGARFENLIATHLLKLIHFLEDRDGYRYELRYVRDKEGHEVDFVVLKERKPIELIEAKWADDQISRSLKYFSEKISIPRATQIIGQPIRKYSQKNIEVVSAIETLTSMSRAGW